MKRRKFIQLGSALAGYGLLATSCSNHTKRKIAGEIIGASSQTGHLLRDKQFETPSISEQKEVVIVGSGISGLSAARWLHRNGQTDFLLLDLEKHTGGNASSGANAVSAYPWGAHYIPIPNNDLPEYTDFLTECNVITGRDEKGLPVYNEYHLCSDPQERLFINGNWQDGLIPQYGLSSEEKSEVKRFLQQMQTFREAKGNDGKDAFAIPVNNSSKDPLYTSLDNITMAAWLQRENYHSKYVQWYANYCTRDDFGTRSDVISAWTGIHYFAARKGNGANAKHDDVLTWPQGNGWLAEQLSSPLQPYIRTNALAVKIIPGDKQVTIVYYDVNTHTLKAVAAKQCILATPQFVNNRLLDNKVRTALVDAHLHYAPWMVANLTVSQLKERDGAPLSWDNVLYESFGLGYVDATHQQLQQLKPKRVLTYYLPLSTNTPKEERLAAYKRSHEDWINILLGDLKKVHPDIEEKIERADVMVWGHAMAQPLPGLMHGDTRRRLQESIDNQIHFAHTDLAGISIFEEAFYQGIGAAKKVIGS